MNAFDDIPTVSSDPSAPNGYNAFDDIAPPVKPVPKPKEDRPWYSVTGDDLKHQVGMAGRVATSAVTALPLMAEDFGVGARNLYGKVTGGQSDFAYPSDAVHSAMDQYFGRPQGAIEKATDILGPAALGASATGLPNALATVAGGAVPEAATTLSPFVLNPTQSKAQFTADLLRKWQAEGGVVPPSTTNPTVLNHVLETVSGKIGTQQEASSRNADVVDKLSARSIGLNPDVPITQAALNAVRAEAGKSYEAIRNVGKIIPDQQFYDKVNAVKNDLTGVEQSFPGSKPSPLTNEINSLVKTSSDTNPLTLTKSPVSFDANDAISKIKQLRDSADVAGRSGDKGLAKGYQTLSQALEEQIDRSLQNRIAGGDTSIDPKAVANFQNARKTIAKSYSIGDALNEGNNHVSAAKLASSGDPLDGDLKLAATIAKAYPKAMQDPAKIGSKGVSHLDTMGTLLAGSLGEHATGSGWGIAAAAGYPVARMGAKKYLMSGAGQSGAIPDVALNDLGPTRAKAAALAEMLRRYPQDDQTPAPAY